MADRAKLAARIRALLAKTVDNGCTEAEAIAAADLAKKLMDEYQLGLSDLEIEQEGVSQERPDRQRSFYNLQSRIANAVARFCECKVWLERGHVVYFGLSSDAEFAKWLTAALESFCWMKADEYLKANKRPGQSAAQSVKERTTFLLGCAVRLVERLNAESEAREKTRSASTGRSLVVVKNAIVTREFAKLGFRLRKQSRREQVGGSRASFQAGMNAANGAGFGRPINGGSRPLAIGRK